ncbi:MAG: hypothetical protein ABJK11_05430 [Balneola sp.]
MQFLKSMTRILLIGILIFCFSTSSVAQKRSVGIVTLENYEESDSLTFYNQDGSIWLKFDPYFRENESEFTTPKGFRPHAFHPDYFLIALRVIAIDDSTASVIINENSKALKDVDLNHHTLKFQSWKEHFLDNIFSISLKENVNSLWTKPNEDSQQMEAPAKKDYVRLIPINVKNDWLQVKWKDPKTDKIKTGWVKWRNAQDEILINLFYFA